MLTLPLLTLLVFGSWVFAHGQERIKPREDDRPNIVFIFTDDQDALMNSLDYMGGVKSHLLDQGTQFKHHYCTVALCCPSRVNLWTGQAAHNTNVTSVKPPYGGYTKFISQGYNDNWLPGWMQDAGYSTYYTGKLMNYHRTDNYNNPFVKGFDGSDFLLDPNTYFYVDPIFQRNHEEPVRHQGEYSTDVLANKSLAFLDEAVASGKPFFATFAPIGPHDDFGGPSAPWRYQDYGPIPAERHRDLFPDVKVPRTYNFNPESPSGSSWVKELDVMNASSVERADTFYRLRLQALQSVDELVNRTIAKLEEHGVLDNTYIVFSSDNGYHIGQHRLDPGKLCPYEEDINVPLIVRGPGIKKKGIVELATSHTDLAPTFLSWARAKLPDHLDGGPIPVITDSNAEDAYWEHAQVENWEPSLFEGEFGRPAPAGARNNTYKSLRVIGNNYNWYYGVWCTGEHEIFDMNRDPGQMNNLANQILAADGLSIDRLQSRLDALLLVLKTCKADSCRHPWAALHLDGLVNNLGDALEHKYDGFYSQQNKVAFESCEPGYILDAELPVDWHTYGPGD